MKTKEELAALKEEVEAMNKKLAELTEEELKQVVGGKAVTIATTLGGASNPFDVPSDEKQYENHIYTPETEEEARKKFLDRG